MNIFFASLGCDKNLVDSEKMLSLIDKANHRIIDDEYKADIIIVNTCAFINDAMQESIDSIIEYGSYKNNGNLKGLIVTGCLAQRYKDEILNLLPEIDVLIGTNSYDKIVEAINDIELRNYGDKIYTDLDVTVNPSGRMLSTGGHFAHLKIAEGCNKRCTYCIIPSLRGRYRSFPMQDIITEAKTLVHGGVKELILIAQETTVYGLDIYHKKMLPKLLDELQNIDDLKWIRLMYCYPEEIDDELIDAIIRNDKVCHYIDMPIQHCNDNILKSMGRKTDFISLNAIIKRLRLKIPDIVIRTTLITGFPGEDDAINEELLRFVQDVKFERLGVFKYSRQEDTIAYNMPNQIDEKTKDLRYDKIMALQKDICEYNNKKLLDKELEVFIEGRLTDDNIYVGRTFMDAPEIDSLIFVESDNNLMSGDFVKCKVTSFNEYDLIGVQI